MELIHSIKNLLLFMIVLGALIIPITAFCLTEDNNSPYAAPLTN